MRRDRYILAAVATTLLVLLAAVALRGGRALGQNLPGVVWPAKISAPPAYVRLPAAPRVIDGRDSRTWLQTTPGLRFRPWPDAAGRTSHADLVVEDMKVGYLADANKALMISSGSTDKPRTAEGQVASYRSITLRRLNLGPMFLRPGQGIHTDLIWLGPGADAAVRPDVLVEDVFLHDANGGVMGLLLEDGGNWGTITFRRVAMAGVVQPMGVKCGRSTWRSFVIDSCPQTRWTFDQSGTTPLVVTVRNSPGISIATPATNVRVVYEAAAPATAQVAPSTQTIGVPATRATQPATGTAQVSGIPATGGTQGTATLPSTRPATAPFEFREVWIGGRRFRLVGPEE
jgi:hypothetical protein